jgi:hypothetical protein
MEGDGVTRVKFTYPLELLHRPIIYELGKQSGVVTNICRANISDTWGWVDMELVGAPMAVEAALAWVKGQGLKVDIVQEPGAAHLGCLRYCLFTADQAMRCARLPSGRYCSQAALKASQ